MATIKRVSKNPLTDFVGEEQYNAYRKSREEVEKGTYAIYIFSTFVLLWYVIHLMMNTATFNWLDFGISVLMIALYYLLGYYSNHQPYTSFISILALLAVVTLLQELFMPGINFAGTVIKFIFIIFICLKMGDARKVQAYEKKNKNRMV